MRLGFPVSVLGKPRLKSHDGRHWQNGPHLSVSLLYLRDILEYLHEQGIHMYRMSSQLAPYLSHPGLPEFHAQISHCAEELAFVGRLATAYDIRLSFHATPYVSLSTPDQVAAEKSMRDLAGWTEMLDRMGTGPESIVVLHLGGAYEDVQASKARFAARCLSLPNAVRRRLALENDDSMYSVADVLDVAEQAGLPVVFDYLHYLNHNPKGMSLAEALTSVWATWPAGVRPKVHFSSPRTEMKWAGRPNSTPITQIPRWTEHADFINPFEFISFVRHLPAQGEVDIMLEAKAKDLAVLRLRADLHRYAPEIARRLD